MPRSLTHQAKSLLLVLLLLFAWWVTPAVFKRWSGVIFQEFQAPAWTALSYLRDLRTYWTTKGTSKSELIEAGVDLSRLNAAYALRIQQTDSLEREVERLESFFELPSYPDFRYEVARVVKRDLSAWWQTIVIRKGINYGIRPGQAVVFSGGVVGRIESVNAYTATVELLSSPRFRTAAHIEGDLRPIEYRGGLNPGLGDASGLAMNIPADAEASLREPLKLTSSRLGGVFPDGLTIGRVYRLDPSPDGLFQSGIVRLDPRLKSLREVAVLVPLEEIPQTP